MLSVKLWGGKLWYQVKPTSYDWKDILIEYWTHYTFFEKNQW